MSGLNLHHEAEIKYLLTRERHYRDTRQWKKLRESYHKDASKTSIKITWSVSHLQCSQSNNLTSLRFTGDIDGFVAGSEKMSRSGTEALHTICPIEVHISGTKAISESTGSITVRFTQGGMDYDCTSLCRFVSRLELVDGVWRMLTLEAIYVRDYILPAFPGKAIMDVPMDVLKGKRASYKYLGWLLAQKGFEVAVDLPGTDDADSIKRVMDASTAWLDCE
jgi:hypothetical protein